MIRKMGLIAYSKKNGYLNVTSGIKALKDNIHIKF